jgi:fatty acid desaturase
LIRTVAENIAPDRAGRVPAAFNLALAFFYIAVNLYQFLIFPLWLLRQSSAWVWTLLPLALLNNPYWSLIHEAIHDLFHPRRAINMYFGRLLAILFGAPFRILRMSHLLHHNLNRTPSEATELYERGKKFLATAAGATRGTIFAPPPHNCAGRWRWRNCPAPEPRPDNSDLVLDRRARCG